MDNKQLPDISVGDFAMSVLNDMAKNPSKSLKPSLKESSIGSDRAPDISHIEVPDDFARAIVEGKKPQVLKTKPKQIKETMESRMEELVERFSTLVSEAKQLMNEMTSCGNIGTPGPGAYVRSKLKAKRRRR